MSKCLAKCIWFQHLEKLGGGPVQANLGGASLETFSGEGQLKKSPCMYLSWDVEINTRLLLCSFDNKFSLLIEAVACLHSNEMNWKILTSQLDHRKQIFLHRRGSTQKDQHGDRPPIENIGGGRLDWRQRRKIFFVRLRFRCLRYNWVELVVGQLWKKTFLHRHLFRFEHHKKNTFHFLQWPDSNRALKMSMGISSPQQAFHSPRVHSSLGPRTRGRVWRSCGSPTPLRCGRWEAVEREVGTPLPREVVVGALTPVGEDFWRTRLRRICRL